MAHFMNDLATMTWPGVNTVRDALKAEGRDVLVWGWGSTEQHGPRGLLGTDNLIADHFVHLVGHRRQAICLPTVPIGMSRHHEAFPGTVSLTPEAAISLAMSVLRSVHRMGSRKLFALMGHGGNVKPFHAAVAALGKEIDGLKVCEPLDALFYTTEGELGHLLHSFGEEVSHAGAAEISILYALIREREELWDIFDQLQSVIITDAMVRFGSHGQGTQGGDPRSFRDMFPSGSKGDQRNASLNKGQRMLELMDEAILRAYDEFATS